MGVECDVTRLGQRGTESLDRKNEEYRRSRAGRYPMTQFGIRVISSLKGSSPNFAGTFMLRLNTGYALKPYSLRLSIPSPIYGKCLDADLCLKVRG
jgi:hypothetical protein